MGQRLRDQAPGLHHLVCRGNNKRRIFRSDDDRDQFLEMLNRAASRNQWSIHAYALMTNHYHLIVRVEEHGLAKGMCRLNTGYAVWLNEQEGRINHVFGRRYWSDRLGDERRYFAALRYVIRNPTRAGICHSPSESTWSSYAATLGRAAPPIALARRDLLRHFDQNPIRAVEGFRSVCGDPEGPTYDRAAEAERYLSGAATAGGSHRYETVRKLAPPWVASGAT